jgi:hypothetical protein
LWLVKNGVPFDTAFALDDITRTGWCIIFSEMDGATFNFHTMQYDEQK